MIINSRPIISVIGVFFLFFKEILKILIGFPFNMSTRFPKPSRHRNYIPVDFKFRKTGW